LNSYETSEPSNNWPASYPWLVTYKYYLIAIVALSVIGLGMSISSYYDLLARADLSSIDQYKYSYYRQFAINIARIGLFIFAINSLKGIGEMWVRTLHLSINGVAAVTGVLAYLPILRLWAPPDMFLSVGYVAVIPIGVLVPWSFLISIFPSGLVSVAMMILNLAINTVALGLAVFWLNCWRLDR
jgi:hypothetical protein